MPKPKEFPNASLRRIIRENEVPLRSKTFSPAAVDQILRYGAIVGNTIEHHVRLGRGMDRARQLIREADEANLSFPSGLVILADEMLQSKGRFNRSWHAPSGGLWLTLTMVNTLLPEISILLPMAAGVSCCEVLRANGIKAQIRWVNDILADRKKIAGILTESFTGPRSGEEYILIGIGINVNNSRFPEIFSEQAISAKLCLDRELQLGDLALQLLAKLRWNIGLLYYEETLQLEKFGGIGKNLNPGAPENHRVKPLLLQSYETLTDIFDRRVLFGFNVRESPQFEATVVGLNNLGGLLLELDDKSVTVQYSGEILYLD